MLIEKDFTTIEEMHRAARGFLNAASLLYADCPSWEYYALHAPAFAVNLSFACEISLKEALLLTGNSYKGIHYLDDLFAALPKDIQLRIQDAFQIKCPNNHIKDCLRTYRNAFVIWRYLHEQEGSIPVPGDDLFDTAKAIRLIVKELFVAYAKELGKDFEYAD